MAKINYDGTNIVGGPFKPYVDEQIKVRQEKLGNFNKTSEEIVWENGKSAFVALASSVNIANSLVPKDTKFTSPETGEEFIVFEQYTGAKTTSTSTIPFYDFFDNTIEYELNTDGEERVKLLNLAGDPQQYFGNFLARNIVLYGGTSYYTKDSDDFVFGPNYRFGITKKDNVFDDSAYGFGGTNPDGFKPMPGITSFNIKSKNMGSLRDATVTIRANSEEQFKMVDNLYCRIGYTMFLEWGNSLYFDNEGRYQKIDYQTSMIPMFLSGKIIEDGVEIDLTKDPTSFLSRIETYRELSNGNYDAFFGRVKNFSWEYIAKGGYWEITLSMISWGDIIESLTIDGQYGTLDPDSTGDPNASSALTYFLSIVSTPNGNQKVKDYAKPFNLLGDKDKEESNFTPSKNTLVSDLERKIQGTTRFNQSTQTFTASNTIDSLNYTRLSTSFNSDGVGKIISAHAQFSNKHYYYIRFGDILDFIRDRLLLYTESSTTPIIDIDTDTLKNICYNPGVNMSADPSKVMVNNIIPYGYNLESLREVSKTRWYWFDKLDWEHDINTDSIFRYQKDSNGNIAQLENFSSRFNPNNPTEDFPLHGKIMNIYFEYQYLIDTIKELRNEENFQIPLYDFVSKLLETANNCLGGVNKLSIRLEDDRIMKIYDQNPIYGTQVPDNEGTTINLYGMNPITDTSGFVVKTEGSFVTDVNIKTELTNDFSTTVSVGAQAQGKTIGEDATGLSRWNFGLVDRYYPTKVDSLRKNTPQTTLSPLERIEKLRSQLKFLWFGYAEASFKNAQNLIEVTNEEGEVINEIEQTINDTYSFPNFPLERIPEFINTQKKFLAEVIKYENDLVNAGSQSKGISRSGTNQIGMIPINIQITMDGLSGIRIYDRLKVDTRFLPNYYPQTLYWIIKGVSHEVVNNKWNTKLETIAVPKLSNSQNLQDLVPQGGNPGNSGNSGNSNSTNKILFEEFVTNMVDYEPNDELLWAPIENLSTVSVTSIPKPARSLGGGTPRNHYGIDIGAPVGTKLYAAADGTFKYGSNDPNGYGDSWGYIEEYSTSGSVIRRHIYGHTDSLLVANVTSVKKGDIIATVGNKGRSSGPHLHYEIWYPSKPKRLSPVAYLNSQTPIPGAKRFS